MLVWRKATAVHGWRVFVADGLVEVEPASRVQVPQARGIAVAIDAGGTRSPCSLLTHTADRRSLES